MLSLAYSLIDEYKLVVVEFTSNKQLQTLHLVLCSAVLEDSGQFWDTVCGGPRSSLTSAKL